MATPVQASIENQVIASLTIHKTTVDSQDGVILQLLDIDSGITDDELQDGLHLGELPMTTMDIYGIVQSLVGLGVGIDVLQSKSHEFDVVSLDTRVESRLQLVALSSRPLSTRTDNTSPTSPTL